LEDQKLTVCDTLDGAQVAKMEILVRWALKVDLELKDLKLKV